MVMKTLVKGRSREIQWKHNRISMKSCINGISMGKRQFFSRRELLLKLTRNNICLPFNVFMHKNVGKRVKF